MRKSLARAMPLVVVAVLLGACGGVASLDGQTKAPGDHAAGWQADYNEQDVSFVLQMVPPLSQARDLAKLVPERSANPKVLEVAARVMRSQNPDIQQLMAWLHTWGMDTGAIPGMNEGFMSNVNKEAIRQLGQADAPQFDRMWANMTIEQFQSAIGLARGQLAGGVHPEVRQFARRILDAREADVAEMQEMA